MQIAEVVVDVEQAGDQFFVDLGVAEDFDGLCKVRGVMAFFKLFEGDP